MAVAGRPGPCLISTMKIMYALVAGSLLGSFASLVHAQSQTQPAAAQTLHPWQASYPAGDAQAYFTNLKNGDVIETPYLVKFGLSGNWGLAPISAPTSGKSGHHHLLVNRDLPLDFKKALPFNDQYIHFGSGQMETVLTLAPGTYTLRMLLADDKHLPHFVYSKPIKITVRRKSTEVDPKSLARRGISLELEGGTVKAPFRVQFHASAFNVGHLSQQLKDTGHFKLTVTPKAGGKPAVMDFAQGQTEVFLQPPAGDYALKLEFLENVPPGKSLTEPVTTAVLVQ